MVFITTYIRGGIQVGFVAYHHDLVGCIIVIAIRLSRHPFKQCLKVSNLYHFGYTVLIFDDRAQLHAHLQVT